MREIRKKRECYVFILINNGKFQTIIKYLISKKDLRKDVHTVPMEDF